MEREASVAKPRVIYSLDRLFILLFDKIGLRFVRAFELDKAIASAMMKTHPLVYGARAVGYTFIALLTGIAIVGIALLVRPSLMILVAMTLAGIFLPSVVLTIFIAFPAIARDRRRSLVESELPFFVSYLSIMARGGVPITKAMEAFRKTPLFRGIRLEAQEFFRRIGLFGKDPIAALEEISSHHPSQMFRDLILGYVITLRTGGDVVRYLETRSEESFRRLGEMIGRMVQRLGVYMEIYMLISIVGGLGFFLLFTSAGGIQGIQAGRFTAMGYDPRILVLFNLVVIPLLTAVILYAAHIAQPRWGLGFWEVTYVALLTAAISPLSYLVVILATGGYQIFSGIYTRQAVLGQVFGVAAALLTISTPAWLAYRRVTKGLRAIEKAIALYIESMSEMRKTGLSPERSLVEASKRDYGPLNPIVRRLAMSIEIGIDIENAVRGSLRGVRSWLVRVIFRFVIDSIKVGGGSPEIFYSLARYTSAISEAYERLRTNLKIYVLMPYIGAMLFVITSTVYISLIMAQPIPVAGSKINVAAFYMLNLIASLTSITTAWMMGIVAGKISGLTMGEGFKHATILTIVTTLVLWIFIQLFIPP